MDTALPASGSDPRSYRDAVACPDGPPWIGAMSDDMAAHQRFGTIANGDATSDEEGRKRRG